MDPGTATSAAEWEDLTASRFVPMRVDDVAPGFRGSMDTIALGGGAGVAVVDSDACRLIRTPRLAAADDREPAFLLSVQRFGPFEIGQLDRQARVSAGEAVLYASDTPFDLGCPQRTGCLSLSVPASALGLRRAAITPLLARPIPTDTPALHVLGAFATAVSTMPRDPGEQTLNDIGQTAADLLRTLVLSLTTNGTVPAGRAALVFAMRRFIADHLHEPDLTVAQVAGAHRVSPRYMAMVFSDAGLPAPATCIREERLQRATRLLAGDAPVVFVGRCCGFADPTTFTRAFRRRFGTTPSEWRRAAVCQDRRVAVLGTPSAAISPGIASGS